MPGNLPPFFLQVKDAFAHDGGEGFKSFILLMKEFKLGNVTTEDVAQQTRVLFAGKEELLVGFNAFLPANLHYKG